LSEKLFTLAPLWKSQKIMWILVDTCYRSSNGCKGTFCQ